MASSSCVGRVSLSRNPLAPARSASCTSSSSSNVVRTSTCVSAQPRVGHDPSGGLQAVHPWHPDVHQHDVGRRTTAQVPGLLTVSGLADDLDVGGRPQEYDEPGSHQLLVVDDRHPDHDATGSGEGRWAATRKPDPSSAPYSKVAAQEPGALAQADEAVSARSRRLHPREPSAHHCRCPGPRCRPRPRRRSRTRGPLWRSSASARWSATPARCGRRSARHRGRAGAAAPRCSGRPRHRLARRRLRARRGRRSSGSAQPRGRRSPHGAARASIGSGSVRCDWSRRSPPVRARRRPRRCGSRARRRRPARRSATCCARPRRAARGRSASRSSVTARADCSCAAAASCSARRRRSACWARRDRIASPRAHATTSSANACSRSEVSQVRHVEQRQDVEHDDARHQADDALAPAAVSRQRVEAEQQQDREQPDVVVGQRDHQAADGEDGEGRHRSGATPRQGQAGDRGGDDRDRVGRLEPWVDRRDVGAHQGQHRHDGRDERDRDVEVRREPPGQSRPGADVVRPLGRVACHVRRLRRTGARGSHAEK